MECNVAARLYLTQPYLASLVTSITRFAEGMFVLPETIFHPQGGGQPADVGALFQGERKIFQIEKQGDVEDGVAHYGQVLDENVELDQPVRMEIGIEKRMQLAKIHSRGHLLDLAVSRLGLNFIAGKGYHFPESPYVEYKVSGTFSAEEKAKLIEDLNQVANEIIKEEHETTHEFRDGMRIVKLTSYDPGCPCLGTHVPHVNELEAITVRKIVKKQSNLRVAYA